MGRITAFSSLRQEECLHVDGAQMDRRVSALHRKVTIFTRFPCKARWKMFSVTFYYIEIEHTDTVLKQLTTLATRSYFHILEKWIGAFIQLILKLYYKL